MIDAGFRSYRHERVRLLRCDAPEVRGPTREAGLAATAFTRAWLADAGTDEWNLIVTTRKADSFGRYLGEVVRTSDGANLSTDLLAGGFAIPYERNTP